MDPLDFKYAKSVVIELYKKSPLKKSDFYNIVKSHQALDNLIDALENSGYLVKTSNKGVLKIYTISITGKGKTVAENLLNAELAAEGKLPPLSIPFWNSEIAYRSLEKQRDRVFKSNRKVP